MCILLYRACARRKEARATGKATHAAIYSYSRNALPVLVGHGSGLEIDCKNLRCGMLIVARGGAAPKSTTKKPELVSLAAALPPIAATYL